MVILLQQISHAYSASFGITTKDLINYGSVYKEREFYMVVTCEKDTDSNEIR